MAKGYTAIEVGIAWRNTPTNRPPFNGAGTIPFLGRLDGAAWTGSIDYGSSANQLAPDLSTPNPAYWTFVDNFLNDCLSRGLLVFMFPAYIGFPEVRRGGSAS